MRSKEENELIKDFVNTTSHTWYAGNKRQWMSKVKLFLEVSEAGMTADEARQNLIDRISNNDFLFSYLKGPNNVQPSTKARTTK